MSLEAEKYRLVEWACVEYERDLRAFLTGVLRNADLADEALQQTTLKALKTSSVPQSEAVRGWLLQIGLNVARDLKRDQTRDKNSRQQVHDLQSARQTNQLHDGLSRLIAKEEQDTVRQAIDQLNSNYREVVIRRVYHGQTFAEISQELDRPLGTILTWMRRAVGELRNLDAIQHLFR